MFLSRVGGHYTNILYYIVCTIIAQEGHPIIFYSKKIVILLMISTQLMKRDNMPLYMNFKNGDIAFRENKWSFIQTKNIYSALLHGLSYKLHDN